MIFKFYSDFPVENEPILGYRKGSKERKELIEALNQASSKVEDVPIMIAGEEIRTKDERYQVIFIDLSIFFPSPFSWLFGMGGLLTWLPSLSLAVQIK